MRMRSLLPAPARRLARQYHQWLSFQRVLGRSNDRLEKGELPASEVSALSYGWGNEGFSAEDIFLHAVVRHAAVATAPVLECGSGLSTILLAIATRQARIPVWSLESHEGWAGRVRRWLPKGSANTTVQIAPLKSYGAYDWYTPDFSSMPTLFSLVVCDGPPGETRGGRYGLVPVMRKYLAPGCVILLDDANRDAERTVAERWARELGASLTIEGTGHAFAKLTLPS
jgi:hypothetical protein